VIIPDVLQGKNPPSNDEVIAKLMESIADEEIALANIISSEADKINAFVGENFDFPTAPSNKEIIEFNKSIHRIIESVLMKEWLLLKKLETVISIKDKIENEKCKDHSYKKCEDESSDGFYKEESSEDFCYE
jgi:hypothetical protein